MQSNFGIDRPGQREFRRSRFNVVSDESDIFLVQFDGLDAIATVGARYSIEFGMSANTKRWELHVRTGANGVRSEYSSIAWINLKRDDLNELFFNRVGSRRRPAIGVRCKGRLLESGIDGGAKSTADDDDFVEHLQQ